jgi:hypothetical protein
MERERGRMRDHKYAIEIMKQELGNKYISPGIKYAFEASIEALEKQMNNGWIPVSERLPEVFNENTSETVLITDGNWIAMGFINNNQQWLFAECSNKGTDIDWTDITAWQPLPEAYREVSE